MEGHQRVGHDPDARSRHGRHRSVLRGDDGQPALRRDRADDHAGLRARSALARQARGSLSQIHRASPTARCSGRRTSSSSSTACATATRCSGAFYAIDSVQGAWNSPQGVCRRQQGPSPRHQGRLLPGAAGGCVPGHPLGDVPGVRGDGTEGRSAPPRGGDRRTVRDRHRRGHAGHQGRPGADPQVRGAERGPRLRQDRDLHAKAAGRRQRQRHARAPVAAEGRQARCSPATSTAGCRIWRCITSAASSGTPRRSTPSPTPAPTATSAWCPASRRR